MAAISRHGDSLPGPFTIAPDNVKLPSPSERPDVARHIYDWYHRHAAGRTLVQMVAKALRVS